jgi:hypothetical protein
MILLELWLYLAVTGRGLDVAGTMCTDQRTDRGHAMPRSSSGPILCMKSLLFFRTTAFKWHMEQGNVLNLNMIGI